MLDQHARVTLCSWDRTNGNARATRFRLTRTASTSARSTPYLTRSYWAAGVPPDVVSRSIAGSLCFGLFDEQGRQVGLARVVTDRATFVYLCDVYVLEDHRGRGLGKWLMEVMLAHEAVQGLRRFALATRDAHAAVRPVWLRAAGGAGPAHGDPAAGSIER